MKRRIPALCSEEQTTSSAVKRTKVHAQRKFAQGSSNFVYTSAKILSKPADSTVPLTLQASQPSKRVEKDECELNNFSSLPTIDDFLTFLCFRETEVLPERLNYLNSPQLEAPQLKKKSSKANTVSFQESKAENNKESTCKSGGKLKSSLKKKKNKTKTQEYKLRSHNIKNNIVRKLSHALALKHNQRLRSKTVVKAKCSENKLQNLKSKTSTLTRVIPRPSHPVKNNSRLPNKTSKSRPLTRAHDRLESTVSFNENDFRRVTRRNSTIDRNDSLSKHCANQALKKPIKVKSANNVKKVVPVVTKKPAKSLKISLPKFKNNVTDMNVNPSDTPSKPVTRSSRSDYVQRESTPISTNVRPSRRTKEAAALYMEMLGKELLCPDESFEDDDDISIDSFPELPNTEELNRREKEIKELYLKKTLGKLPTTRKTTIPKSKSVAKAASIEPAPTSLEIKASTKSIAVKDKVSDTAEEKEIKNSGLCTRSKQYKPESSAATSESSIVAVRKEQQSSSPSSASSVKIIRTRPKNDAIAAVIASGANMGRRNSYNDAFDVAKRVTGTFSKETGGRRDKLITSNDGDDDVDHTNASSLAPAREKKASETVAGSESVTIKRLSTGKYGGDEKSKKVTGGLVRSKFGNEFKTKKDGLIIPRRSSEPVIIEQLKNPTGSDDYKIIKSFVLEINEDNEAEPLRQHEKSVGGSVKCLQEKTIQKVSRSSSCTGGNRGSSNNANNNTNSSTDPVIIERIPSRKNSELKSAKRNNYTGINDKHSATKKKVEETGVVKVSAECRSTDINRKSSIAETKSKIATHNLSVKSLKPAATSDVRSKDASITSTATAINYQKPTAKLKNTFEMKSTTVVKSNAPEDDLKTVKPTSRVDDAEILNKNLPFIDVMSFDDSDDEFLVPPKLPKRVDSQSPRRAELDEHTDVSSTDDHRPQTPKMMSATTSQKKSVISELTKKIPASTSKEVVFSKEVLTSGHESESTEKHSQTLSFKATKSAADNVTQFEKSRSSDHDSDVDVSVSTADLVVPKCEALDDTCDNQTFALDMYDDSTEICEKLSVTPDAVISSKQELIVTTSISISSSSNSSSNNNSNTNNSNNNNRDCVRSSLDFKKPVHQTPKSFFSTSSSMKSKTVKEEKPLQSVASTNQKVVSVDSKKIIFKKNSYLTSSPTGGDLKEENGVKKSEAFSPDNENSVYAFEPDLPSTSPPFRRLKPVTPSKSICNSIAVQVNFESDSKIECSGSGDTQVSSTTDCGDRVFYIPIQTSADTTSTLGVAVKLGTDGPNQKIIMSAKLITDSATFTTTSTSTSVSSKSTYVETCCTQTESVKMSTTENVAKKLESATAKKGNSEKVVTSSEGTQPFQIPCNPASSLTKINKKTLPTVMKPSSQSVKIVKLNKNKKLKDLENESQRSKTRPVKPKSVKKSIPSVDPNKGSSVAVGEILEAPTFYPSAEEFNDPLEYIDTIRSVAEKYGLCRIVPPPNFRPECKVADEMRFTAYNQYVHKMLHRWGPNVKEMMVIKKFLSTQNITLTQAPLIGGMEIDLPRLYQIVQQCGGLNAVIEKERWQQVADIMKIPKLAQDRITKLDDIYCKYLLPYDVLSHAEREKLFGEIEEEWLNHLRNSNDEDIFDDVDECIVKGRTMPLSCFYRIARNTMMMCFGNMEGQEGSSTEKIEEEFWNHVSMRKSHVCVHSGSIDSGTYGYGFSMAKNSAFRKHPWNLKVLTNNSASILRSLGPVMGVTVPTLHVGMLYSACCWYRDPHGLPWIEYLHTGANKIWYGIPDEHSEQFKEAMLLLVPRYCRDKKIWLPSDTVMIPPPLLTAKNISLSRVVQHPGQFIVVFPKAFTSSISTGYLVSESVYFAHASWLNSAKQVFKDMQDSCEPSIFSLEQLLISIAEDARSSVIILNKLLPLLVELRDTEVALRNHLKELGLNTSEKLNTNKKRKSKSAFSDEDLYECEICRTNLFVSLIENSHDQSYYCLRHAATFLYKKPTQVKHCKLLYAYTEDELKTMTEKVKNRIEAKSSKKSHAK